jgi:hypothetical protein
MMTGSMHFTELTIESDCGPLLSLEAYHQRDVEEDYCYREWADLDCNHLRQPRPVVGCYC